MPVILAKNRNVLEFYSSNHLANNQQEKIRMSNNNEPALKAFITGRDLRDMRTKSGLTTNKMASVACVKTRKTYENWEKNVGCPSMNQLIAMMFACNVKPSQFINECIKRDLIN
jgi:DNA-binding transcriptional regulator YiaG